MDQFEGLDSYGAKVNGKLTVSENVADLGGVACALEAAKRDEDFRFENSLSTLRRFGVRRHVRYMQMLASVDVHAPAKWRTNVIVTNFDEFHKEFDVKRETACGRAPEDRVIIW